MITALPSGHQLPVRQPRQEDRLVSIISSTQKQPKLKKVRRLRAAIGDGFAGKVDWISEAPSSAS